MSVLDELVDGEALELELAPPEEPLELWSAEPLVPALPPLEPPPDEALLEGEDALPDGEVEDPAPAEPLIEPDAEPEGEAVEPDGAELDDEAEPDGEDGELVAPVDELELEPEGEVLGEVLVVPPRDADPVSSARSHAVRKAPPKATETARARVESFMEPP